MYNGDEQYKLFERMENDISWLKANSFCTIDQYNELTTSGVLVRKRILEDDFRFKSLYPDHPMAVSKRMERIKAADDILRCAENIGGELPEKVLSQLHEILFDCCAAVRDSISQALFHIGSPSSIPYLQALVDSEKDSEIVLENAKAALVRCKMKENNYVQSDDRLIMLVSNRIDLAKVLLDVAEQTGCKLFIPEPNFTELIAWRSEVQIIDRWYMGEKSWNMFSEYLHEVNKLDKYPIKDENGEILIEEPMYDYTPLIIIDNNLRKSCEIFQSPFKPSEFVFYVEGGPDDLVKELVLRLIRDGEADLSSVVEYVNLKRMYRNMG